MIYVISYDIEPDRMRTKLAKLLEGYGVRIQYSVFECSLTEQRFKKLYEEILKLTTKDCPGRVRFYSICKNCANRTVTIGKPVNELILRDKEVLVI